MLNELYPGAKYKVLSSSGPSHSPEFVVEASVNEQVGKGTGNSKKEARINAGKDLLIQLHEVVPEEEYIEKVKKIMKKGNVFVSEADENLIEHSLIS